jgi:hypothetical protein
MWLALVLEQFWQEHLSSGREAESWEKVLRLLTVNRGWIREASFAYIGNGMPTAPWTNC